MILLFPGLIEGIGGKEGRRVFRPQAHIFYSRRVVDVRDGVAKWEGLDGKSERLDEDGEVVEGGGDGDGDGDGEEKEEEEEEEDGHEKKRQKVEESG